MFELIERMRLPVVFFTEGGGGRPGDTDYAVVSALDTRAFALWARLSGVAPRIAVVSGRCFAGNAVLAGSADLIVATDDIALGMGGPAMIAGGGLGSFEPDEIGPIETQHANGVVDVRAGSEDEAVTAAKRLLSYFQGPLADWEEPDPQRLRDVVPERRRRWQRTWRGPGGGRSTPGRCRPAPTPPHPPPRPRRPPPTGGTAGGAGDASARAGSRRRRWRCRSAAPDPGRTSR
jgi:hypothetical protein